MSLSAEKVPLLPFATVTLLASNPVTASLKLNVKLTAPLATPALLSVMVIVGAMVSNAWLTCAGAVAWLPAASVTPVVLTSTVILPSSLASGVTTRV